MHVNILSSRYVMNVIRSLDLSMFLIHVAPCLLYAIPYLIPSNDTNSMRIRSLPMEISKYIWAAWCFHHVKRTRL